MYRFLLTLTATAAILTAASLMPNGAAAIPLGERADIATADRQVDGSDGRDVYQCQFRSEYGQGLREALRERLERLRREREERRQRAERERRERREHLEQERRERRERLERERRERRERR